MPLLQHEVPILNDWYAAGLPEGLEVIALNVYADPAGPTSRRQPGWRTPDFALPLIADDEARTLVQTLGIPAVPFWLVVLPDGRVARGPRARWTPTPSTASSPRCSPPRAHHHRGP